MRGTGGKKVGALFKIYIYIDIMPPFCSLEDTTKISSPSRLNEMAKDVFIDF